VSGPYLRRFEPLLGGEWFAIGSLLVLAPHPDDEVLGCGGLVIAHRERGLPVTVVVMTDGSLGESGKAGDEGYRQTRREESRRAVEALGGADLRFLEAQDGRLAASAGAADQVRAILASVKPATVVFPSPFEVHPDHRATALHAARALESGTRPRRVLACEIGAAMPANVLLDVTPYMQKKERAIACFESQLRHQDLIAKLRAQNRARTVNVDDRAIEYAEAYTVIEPDMLATYLERAEKMVTLVDGMGPRLPG
jgi:LmbE family N-acetylglucosaminyl deacetylase